MKPNKKPEIKPELSAQGIRKRPNPMLPKAMSAILKTIGADIKNPLIVDCGCGQLRNVDSLLTLSSRIVLVDTVTQIEKKHDFFGIRRSIPEFVRQQWPSKVLTVMNTVDFKESTINADIIFTINVLDVLPKETRLEMIQSCKRNLKRESLFVAIVPRNDSWTQRICVTNARYQDGYIFPHPKGYTYYHNWISDSLQKWLMSHDFEIVHDLSIYRQVCLICRPKHPNT